MLNYNLNKISSVWYVGIIICNSMFMYITVHYRGPNYFCYIYLDYHHRTVFTIHIKIRVICKIIFMSDVVSIFVNLIIIFEYVYGYL